MRSGKDVFIYNQVMDNLIKNTVLNVSYLMTQIKQQNDILAVIPSHAAGNWGH